MPRLLRALLLAASAIGAGCASPSAPRGDPWRGVDAGLGFSALPNAGLAGSVAKRVRRDATKDWFAQLELTQQFFDYSDVTGDGNPAAGDWTQVQAGLKLLYGPDEKRHWIARFGAVWFEARGEPNIVNHPGEYWGAYVGVGFETRITEHLLIGPELTVMPAYDFDGHHVAIVPQLTWRLLWRF